MVGPPRHAMFGMGKQFPKRYSLRQETIHMHIFILIFKNVYISARSKSLGALVLHLTENHKSER